MPAIGEISYEPNVRPGNFDAALFKAGIPGHPAAGKAGREAGITSKAGASAKGISPVVVKNNLILPLKIIGLIRNTTNATAAYLQKTSPLIKGIKSTKYLSLAILPFGIFDLFSAGKDFVKAGSADQRLDAGLTAMGEMSGIIESAVTLGEGLSEAGVISKTAMQWATPLTVISAALSVSSIILNIRGLWQTCSFKNELRAQPGFAKPAAPNLKDYVKTLEYLKAKDDAFLKKHFKVDGGKLKEQLERIDKEARLVLKTGNAQKVKESEQKLQRTMAALKGRVNDKIVSHSLGLVSHNVGLVGLGVLMAQPQLTPVALSLFAVSSAISVGRLIFDEVKKRQFETAVGMRIPKPKPAKSASQGQNLPKLAVA